MSGKLTVLADVDLFKLFKRSLSYEDMEFILCFFTPQEFIDYYKQYDLSGVSDFIYCRRYLDKDYCGQIKWFYTE